MLLLFLFVVALLASCLQALLVGHRVPCFRGLSPVVRSSFSGLEAAASEAEGEDAVISAEESATTEDDMNIDISSTYVMCGACKTAYMMDLKDLGQRGARVKCSVCEKEWFQTPQRILKLDQGDFMSPLTDTKIEEAKRIVAERKFTRGPMTDRIGIFVGNLPYEFDEQRIGDLFGEYGIRQISLIRDPEGLSKGFAFVEVSSQADADLMIKEMHHFHTDSKRKLTVRLADNSRGGGRAGGQVGGRSSSQDRGRGGSGGGKKAWTPRG